MKLDSAITVATQNATVVKNPKTFCTRTRAECILGGHGCEGCVGSCVCGAQQLPRTSEHVSAAMSALWRKAWRSRAPS
jgi:hypothetical protein